MKLAALKQEFSRHLVLLIFHPRMQVTFTAMYELDNVRNFERGFYTPNVRNILFEKRGQESIKYYFVNVDFVKCAQIYEQ